MKERLRFLAVKGMKNAEKEIIASFGKTRRELYDKVGQVVDVVYRTARVKRPMMGYAQIGGAWQEYGPKLHSDIKKNFKTKRVSDPNADFGVAVKTGKLQQSIKKETHYSGPNQVKGRVWTDLKYAEFLEFGTSKMRARPFIRPAFDLNRSLIERMVGVVKDNSIA